MTAAAKASKSAPPPAAAKPPKALKADGAFAPSQDPSTPDLVWVPFDPKVATAAGLIPVHPWADNPRIKKGAVARVAKSLKQFGWVRPLVANTWKGIEGELIIGHTTRLAALELGLDMAPVRFRRMAPDQAHAAAIADNRLNEEAIWDYELLGGMATEIGAELFDIAGFDGDAFKRLVGVENGSFLDNDANANSGPVDPTNPNARPALDGFSRLDFMVSLADKAIVLQALSMAGPNVPASVALVQLCKERIRIGKRK